MMFDFNVAESVQFNPWPHSPHSMVLGMIPEKSNVLDVGCASGYMAKELKKKSCKTWGVEIDGNVAERAKPHCEVVAVLDLDRDRTIPFKKNFFDAILLLDVLEHVIRPDLALAEIAQHLGPNGKVFISLPNIARIEYRLKHLLGRFDYEEGGIMSIGHLRFFTRDTSRRMIRECGLDIVSERGTGFASILKSKTGIEFFPTLTAFQFLFECKQAE